jgi:hypothetical protein
MFHCHNLVHEDHAMMAAFNVSDLPNYNYPPQTSKFINPVDPRFISKPYTPDIATLDHVNNVVLPFFGALNGYEFHDEVEDSLVSFYKTATSVITDTAPVQSEFNGHKMKRVPEAKAMPTGLPFKRRYPDAVPEA